MELFIRFLLHINYFSTKLIEGFEKDLEPKEVKKKHISNGKIWILKEKKNFLNLKSKFPL